MGQVSDGEMLRTFNCGVGFNIVVDEHDKDMVMEHVSKYYDCYEIGRIIAGDEKIRFTGKIRWE